MVLGDIAGDEIGGKEPQDSDKVWHDKYLGMCRYDTSYPSY